MRYEKERLISFTRFVNPSGGLRGHFSTSPSGIITDGSAGKGTGDFHFYYYGELMWQWTFPQGGYTGVNFDPMDNLGDIWPNSYEVTYVDSYWNYDPDGDYETTLYICADDGGVPDYDNILYSYGPFDPWAFGESHEVNPPVPFYGREICWVLFSIERENGHPIPDGDGNSGHSWYSTTGYDWELMMAEGGVDWAHDVYADELEIENVATESFGGIKVLYR
jgi:hypothetical protein